MCLSSYSLTQLKQRQSQGHQVLHLIFLTWHMPKPPGQQQHFLFAYVGCVGLCQKSPLAKSTAKFQSHWDSQQAPWSSSKAGSHEGSSIAPQQLCYRERGLFYSGTEWGGRPAGAPSVTWREPARAAAASLGVWEGPKFLHHPNFPFHAALPAPAGAERSTGLARRSGGTLAGGRRHCSGSRKRNANVLLTPLGSWSQRLKSKERNDKEVGMSCFHHCLHYGSKSIQWYLKMVHVTNFNCNQICKHVVKPGICWWKLFPSIRVLLMLLSNMRLDLTESTQILKIVTMTPRTSHFLLTADQ